MLEQFFKDRAAVERLRAGILGSHLEGFVGAVSCLGYARSTIRVKLWLLRDLGQWIESKDLGIEGLKESEVDQFLGERRRLGRLGRSDAQTMKQFLEYLRAEGVIERPKPLIDVSPLGAVYKRYESYLVKERGLSGATVTGYWRFLRRLISERFGDEPIVVSDFTPDDVCGFVLRHARSSSPGVAKLMVAALRSFFRFLFQYGETETDLSAAVPAVASWQLAEVPKHLKLEEVKRVIDTCDHNTAVGRRNRAVLLLIARLGLRASEVVNLRLDDIDWRAGELTVRGKGQLHDRLPLPIDVGEALATYLRQDRPDCSTRKLFVTMRAPYRGFHHPSTVSTIVHRAVERSGLEPPITGAHLLRHSLATGMLREGASMAEIGEILRHRLQSSTEIYAKVDLTGLRSLARPWPINGGV
jgi:site-specific recombinase XerD